MKYSIFYLRLIFLITFCFLQSCTYDKGELPKPITNATYQADIKPIIETYCYHGCHVPQGNGPGDLTTYGGLKAKVDLGYIQTKVLNAGGGMPPPYSTGPTALSTDDLEKLRTWVNNGAQDN